MRHCGHQRQLKRTMFRFAGNFLAYENTVEAFIADYGVGYLSRKGRAMTEMHKHLLGAAFQLAAFRDALAIAR